MLHVVLGQLITTVAMAFFTGRLKQKWCAEAEEQVKLDLAQESSNVLYVCVIKLMLLAQKHALQCLSLLWLLFGTVWSLHAVHWSLVKALYFSISSLSTCEMWPIPAHSPDAHYLVVALFTCNGVPLLCLSAGSFAYYLCRLAHSSDLQQAMQAPISAEELEVLWAMAKSLSRDSDETL